MIAEIPTKSEAYRIAEDMFYVQFNDVFFYVEDEELENFYYSVLRRVFPEISFEKIFPLCGKKNVLDESELCVGQRNKVFIVDKDFDDLTSEMIDRSNLFYLDRYSIENHLLEESAAVNFVIETDPRLKREDILAKLKFSEFVDVITDGLAPITELYYVSCKTKCGHPSVSLGYDRFVQVRGNTCNQITSEQTKYAAELEVEIQRKDGRKNLSAQLRSAKQELQFEKPENRLKHIPGKFILKCLKSFLAREFSLSQCTDDSFSYRLSQHCQFRSLFGLRDKVNAFLIS